MYRRLEAAGDAPHHYCKMRKRDSVHYIQVSFYLCYKTKARLYQSCSPLHYQLFLYPSAPQRFYYSQWQKVGWVTFCILPTETTFFLAKTWYHFPFLLHPSVLFKDLLPVEESLRALQFQRSIAVEGRFCSYRHCF